MMGRWVLLLGVVSAVGCADGGVVVPSAEYDSSACAQGERLPCEPGNPNGPQYVCIDGQWDESLCQAGLPMGGSGN